MTELENRMYDLSKHFESACIAGPWSLDSTFDGKLSKKILINLKNYNKKTFN